MVSSNLKLQRDHLLPVNYFNFLTLSLWHYSLKASPTVVTSVSFLCYQHFAHLTVCMHCTGVNVTTVNLLDGISIIPGVEVNGTSIQVSSDVIEQVTNENLGKLLQEQFLTVISPSLFSADVINLLLWFEWSTCGQVSHCIYTSNNYYVSHHHSETAELRQSPVISTAFLCGRRVCNTTAQALELAKMPSVEIVLKHTVSNLTTLCQH